MADRLEVRSPRITLVALDAALSEMQLNDRPAFFTALGVAAEPSWPPELVDLPAIKATRDSLAAHPEQAGWYAWVFISPIMNRLLGAGGFQGPPNEDGEIEIGYSMLISYRERGLATEAVNALLGWAYADSRVKRVMAHTLNDRNPSRRVLEKAGFTQIGIRTDADAGTELAVWAHDRAAIAA